MRSARSSPSPPPRWGWPRPSPPRIPAPSPRTPRRSWTPPPREPGRNPACGRAGSREPVVRPHARLRHAARPPPEARGADGQREQSRAAGSPREGEQDDLAGGLRHRSGSRALRRRHRVPDLRSGPGAGPSRANQQRLRAELRGAGGKGREADRARGGQGDHAVLRSRPCARYHLAGAQLRGLRPLVRLGARAYVAEPLLSPRGHGQRAPGHAGDGRPAAIEFLPLALPDALDLREPDGRGAYLEGLLRRLRPDLRAPEPAPIRQPVREV